MTLIIGMGRPYDRDRKSLPAVFVHQKLFTCQLVLGIGGIRIGKPHPFRNPVIGRRPLINGCGTGKEILIRMISEQTVIPLHVLRFISDPFAYTVKILTVYGFAHGILIIDIRLYEMQVFLRFNGSVPPG